MADTVTINGEEWVILGRDGMYSRIARTLPDGTLRITFGTGPSDRLCIPGEGTILSPSETQALREMLKDNE